MKHFFYFILCSLFFIGSASAANEEATELNLDVPSAILMEKSTGEVLYEKNSHEKLSPASVTKIMTLLLVMEEIDTGNLDLNDQVVCSEHAASMGGSQVWLEEGEFMTVSDMIKAVTVVSANDCAVALAEHISGSEESFVAKMNQKANELGMKDTEFIDCTGLTDDPRHLTSAYDIALMSRQLIKHEKIKDYTKIWMDSLRNGESELTNTNKLIRFYKGATGLKTGFTNKAMFCLSATAERDGVEYIAVVLKAETSKKRFEAAKKLLNHAFANYEVISLKSPEAIPPVLVNNGVRDSVQPTYKDKALKLINKKHKHELKYEFEIPESIDAPIEKGTTLGKVIVRNGNEIIGESILESNESIKKLTFSKVLRNMFSRLFGGTLFPLET